MTTKDAIGFGYSVSYLMEAYGKLVKKKEEFRLVLYSIVATIVVLLFLSIYAQSDIFFAANTSSIRFSKITVVCILVGYCIFSIFRIRFIARDISIIENEIDSILDNIIDAYDPENKDVE